MVRRLKPPLLLNRVFVTVTFAAHPPQMMLSDWMPVLLSAIVEFVTVEPALPLRMAMLVLPEKVELTTVNGVRSDMITLPVVLSRKAEPLTVTPVDCVAKTVVVPELAETSQFVSVNVPAPLNSMPEAFAPACSPPPVIDSPLMDRFVPAPLALINRKVLLPAIVKRFA